jgi:hypothetical protein
MAGMAGSPSITASMVERPTHRAAHSCMHGMNVGHQCLMVGPLTCMFAYVMIDYQASDLRLYTHRVPPPPTSGHRRPGQREIPR